MLTPISIFQRGLRSAQPVGSGRDQKMNKIFEKFGA